MAKAEEDEVRFSITINSDEAIAPRLIADTIKDAEALLADLEITIRGVNEAEVKWSWADDRPIELTAHVNGVNREELGRIVREAEKGFAAMSTGETTSPAWPETFDKRAKKATKRIVERFDAVDSIAIRGDSPKPVVIEPSLWPRTESSQQPSVARKKYHASVEGLMDVVSVRGRLKASITDTNTNRVIKIHLTDDLFEQVKGVLKKRVVVDGMVTYRDDGSPISVTEITVIRERTATRPLVDFIGAAPNLTGGLDTLDYLDRVRGEDE